MRYVKIAIIVPLLFATIGLTGTNYLGQKLTAPASSPIGIAPEWLGASSVEFISGTGSRIRGWLAVTDDAEGSVVLLHGVRGNRQAMLSRAHFLIGANYSVLLIDLQSHGESDGDQITFGHLESLDVIAAVDFMRRKSGKGPLVVLGWSLGGAAALLADPALPVDGLILEAVYPDIEIAIRNRLRIRMGGLADLAVPFFVNRLEALVGIKTEDLKPMHHAKSVQCPVLVISGEQDQRTTVADTKLLYDVFPGEKSLWLVPGAGHQNLHSVAGIEYEERILEFINGTVQDTI